MKHLVISELIRASAILLIIFISFIFAFERTLLLFMTGIFVSVMLLDLWLWYREKYVSRKAGDGE